MTSSTSPTSSGSSAEVTSSNSMISGAIARRARWRRAAAGRPKGRAGRRSACRRGRPWPGGRARCVSAFGRGIFFTITRAAHHVAERGHVREQVELLEHHADAGAKRARSRPRGDGVPGAKSIAIAELQRAGRRLLEQVDAAQEGGLAAARWADHDHDLAASTSSDTPRTPRRCRSSCAGPRPRPSTLVASSGQRAPPGGPPTG